MARVLLTAHESPWLLDLAVEAQKCLAADGIDLRFWPMGPHAAAALERRGVSPLFAPTIRRVPAAARPAVMRWLRQNRGRILAGDPVEYDGFALDEINAYEARIRLARDSAATRVDLGRSGAGYIELFERHLARFQPDLLIVWWGEWAWARAGAAVARRSGIPVLYFERGPFPGSAQLDPQGANGGASIADPSRWRSLRPACLTPQMEEEVEAFRREFMAGGVTGRPQPARQNRERLARAHDLPVDQDWLFFPAQETTDAVAAIGDLMPALRAHPELALVVKPHPAERARVSRLVRALQPLGPQGRLVDDAHVHDLVAASRWTVTVSSAVGLEAAMFDKPVLALRRALYTGKGFTWDAEDYGTLDEALASLAKARTLSPEQRRARDLFCYYLVSTYLLWGTRDRLAGSANEMSRRIRQLLRPPQAGASMAVIPPGGWRLEPTKWLSARDAYRDIRDCLRHALPWRKPSDAEA